MRDKIKLVSSAGTGYFYTTTKNKKASSEKLRMKKYDPKVRQPDITVARTVLGWEPKVALREGLERSLPYFRAEVLG